MEDLSFQRLREELLQEIRARIGTADSQEAKRVVPRDIFDSKEEQVEKLYIAADEEHRRQGSHGRNGCKNHDGIVPACRACGPSGEGCGIPRRFRRAVVADSSENSCAKILSVLLAVEDVSPSSRYVKFGENMPFHSLAFYLAFFEITPGGISDSGFV